MPLPSLPDECFINVFLFLDDNSLYKCLFVNRHYCKLSIPLIWREPFTSAEHKPSLINTLLACLNEEELSLLVPYAIKFAANNQRPLFEYGKFVRNLNHGFLTDNINVWLNTNNIVDRRVLGLVDVIYRMMMRQGSNIQEFILFDQDEYCPKLTTFMTYGFTNLRLLEVSLCENMINQNAIEFLSMVPVLNNGIVNCDLCMDSVYVELFLDIIKSQPLESMLLRFCLEDVEEKVFEKVFKKILHGLEFRSETLKKLIFDGLVCQTVDLSVISKLEYLEYLEFNECVIEHHEILCKNKLHLKELRLFLHIQWFMDIYDSNCINLNAVETLINSLCSENLLKLSLNIVTLGTVKAVKESCPNISFLYIKIFQNHQFLDSIIPIICEMPSLKTLSIETFFNVNRMDVGLVVEILGDYLTTVECLLLLNFDVDLSSFEYFANNCKANLKKWGIVVDKYPRIEYLNFVDNYQRMHNSLKVLEIKNHENGFNWTNEELRIVDSLKNQGVDIVSSMIMFF